MSDLAAQMDKAAANLKGTYGYCVRDLQSGEVISKNGDVIFPTASTIKTGVMVEAINEVDEGKLKMSDHHPLPPPNDREASMWTYFLRDGVVPDLDGYVNLMITVSDNTALITLRDWLTPEVVNHRLEGFGLQNTKILRSYPGDPASLAALHEKWGMGMTTPNEMNKLLDLIEGGKAASPAGCDKMLRILSHQYWDDNIGVSIPPDVRFASKSGAVDESRSDNAIVFGKRPYILSFYTKGLKDQSWGPHNEAEDLIRQEAKIVWKYMEPNDPYALPSGYENKFMPTGGGV